MKVNLTFGPGGAATQVNLALHDFHNGPVVPVMSMDVARRRCAAHFPPGSNLALDLVYYAPPLTADPVARIFPHYQCGGTGPDRRHLNGLLLPAVPTAAPRPTLTADLVGEHVDASVEVKGGTPPYRFVWQSRTTDLRGMATGRRVAYDLAPRADPPSERLWVTVTDSNGLASSVQKSWLLPAATRAAVAGQARRSSVRPGAVGPLDVGAEFNAWDLDAPHYSSTGFSSVFGSKGVPVAFKWTGTNSWEQDFRDTATAGGDDSDWVDNVDLAWYTGHGWPGGFTFDNTTMADGSIVPADARWGQRDLEWLMIESCQVLNYDGGAVWNRWGPRFDRLHLLNGFHTNAAAISVANGTAGRFAKYLFPSSNGFPIPALKVRQAWAQMAIELEPSGRIYVSMGVYGPGGVTNYDDYFWGQGPVGPDIPKSQVNGYWWLGYAV
jgi:hypothetical protein